MKKLLSTLALFALLVAPARATWSIVAVNTRTHEVAVGTATCIRGCVLERFVPVVVVGRGAGAVQFMLDGGAFVRQRMFRGFQGLLTPREILLELTIPRFTPHARQYGIASLTGPPVTWSGAACYSAVGNVTGSVGDYHYAIQGNVLTGAEVAYAAELAFVTTDGDMGQRLMAAMEGARSMGGDGRCSCDPLDPPGCGSPPPSFTKSAHCGFVAVARVGDVDGDCDYVQGCASGDYYLSLGFPGLATDPDPVLVLQDMYDAWRADLGGRPDHLRSRVTAPSVRMPADGTTRTTFTVELVDVEGTALTSGGADVQVRCLPPGMLSVGEVTDHGDGTYSFPVTAGTTPGTGRLRITADDGVAKATLFPFPSLEIDAVTPLHAGRDRIWVAEDSAVALTVNVPEGAGRRYVILASASGTEPGIPLGDVLLPLNPDEVLWRSLRNANNFRFQNTMGRLDGAGRAEATFTAPAGLLINLIGHRLDWAAIHFDPEMAVTPPVGFTIGHSR